MSATVWRVTPETYGGKWTVRLHKGTKSAVLPPDDDDAIESEWAAIESARSLEQLLNDHDTPVCHTARKFAQALMRAAERNEG